MEKRLPLVLSVPHGGSRVPATYRPHILSSLREVLLDGDLWAGVLFDFADEVLHVEKAEIARLIIDLNREPDDFGIDGIIKEKSLFGNPVWMVRPDPTLVGHLLDTYHSPYHVALREAAQDPRVRLGIDCHTMWAKDPFGENKEERPLICLSNLGDEAGEALDEPLSAPAELLRDMKEIFESEFGERAVGLNTPFRGGAIIKKMRDATRIPWVQLEVNRTLYEPKERQRIAPFPRNKELHKLEMLKGMIRKCLAKIDYEHPRYRRPPFLEMPPRRRRTADD